MPFHIVALAFLFALAPAWSAERGPLPEWETTDKLRYAPPTLVAPAVVQVPTGYKSVELPEDEDAILELPRNATRTRKLMARGGRNIRIIGGDMGKGDLQPMRFARGLFIEGVKFDFAVGQGFIGGHTTRDCQARGLKMTRVNIRANDVWPHNDRSMLLYLGDTDQSSRTTDPDVGRKGVFPVEFDRVYVRPRPEWSLLEMVCPGPGTTRAGVDVGCFSEDGGRTARWRPALGITGHVALSENGGGEDGNDYADLNGPNPPGSSYVSPGYPSDAVTPLVMTAITVAPAEPVLKATDAAGTVVLRLDVEHTGAGHIIDLSLTYDAGGCFALNGRNLVTTQPLDARTYTVTVKATQRGHPANALTKDFTIIVQ